jgi:Flp pilus assembly protein CpaB
MPSYHVVVLAAILVIFGLAVLVSELLAHGRWPKRSAEAQVDQEVDNTREPRR